MDNAFAFIDRLTLCLFCCVFLMMIVMLIQALQKGMDIPLRLKAFYAFLSAGMLLNGLSAYWRIFGAPPGHPALPETVQLCALTAEGAGFWVARKTLRRTMSRFIAANGGTPRSALASALLHPGISLSRLGNRRQWEEQE